MSAQNDDITNLLNEAANSFELPYDEKYWQQFEQLQQSHGLPGNRRKTGFARFFGKTYLNVILGIIIIATGVSVYFMLNHAAKTAPLPLVKREQKLPAPAPGDTRLGEIATMETITKRSIQQVNNGRVTTSFQSGKHRTEEDAGENVPGKPGKKVYKRVAAYYDTKSATHPISASVRIVEEPAELHKDHINVSPQLLAMADNGREKNPVKSKKAADVLTKNSTVSPQSVALLSTKKAGNLYPPVQPFTKKKPDQKKNNKPSFTAYKKQAKPLPPGKNKVVSKAPVSPGVKGISPENTFLSTHAPYQSAVPLLAIAEHKRKKTALNKHDVKYTAENKAEPAAWSPANPAPIHAAPAAAKRHKLTAKTFAVNTSALAGKSPLLRSSNAKDFPAAHAGRHKPGTTAIADGKGAPAGEYPNTVMSTSNKTGVISQGTPTQGAAMVDNPASSVSAPAVENPPAPGTTGTDVKILPKETPVAGSGKTDTLTHSDNVLSNKADTTGKQAASQNPPALADTSQHKKDLPAIADKTNVVKTFSIAATGGVAVYQSMSADNSVQPNTFKDNSYKPDFYAGVQADYNFSKRFSVHTHLLYQQRSNVHLSFTATQTTYDFGKTDQAYSLQIAKLHYLEMPVALGCQVAENHEIYAGAGVSYLLSTTSSLKNFTDTEPAKQNGYSNGVNKVDYFLVAGYYWNLPYNLRANANMEYFPGAAIDKQGFKNTGNTNNRNLKVGISYRFK